MKDDFSRNSLWIWQFSSICFDSSLAPYSWNRDSRLLRATSLVSSTTISLWLFLTSFPSHLQNTSSSLRYMHFLPEVRGASSAKLIICLIGLLTFRVKNLLLSLKISNSNWTDIGNLSMCLMKVSKWSYRIDWFIRFCLVKPTKNL